MPNSVTEITENGITLKPPIGRFLENVFVESSQAVSDFAFFKRASRWMLIPAIIVKEE